MRTTVFETAPALTRLQDSVRAYLRAHSGETITRERLCQEVWGMRYFNSSRTIDQTISVVRKHLAQEERILAVFGVGYRHLFLRETTARPNGALAYQPGASPPDAQSGRAVTNVENLL